ncbi:uncharacterized protein LOC62_01G000863 [Vanrija pseudolonga]|uniref:Uncharacterized protein n=1 Tax=Vanrija pseudolonga TaxID=143232 RepID=A0AAF0Y3E3_9TREE|nr:hypothetical protein LOC62_01G000863 [Vanrija pseudolonga]
MASQTDAIVERLLGRKPLPPLEPGSKVWDTELARAIAGLDEHRFVIAALHLANDDIDACHRIAQASEGDPTADLLHATLHRREGDYWNSKYWYSHVEDKHALARADAAAFVDACAAAAKGKSGGSKLQQRQWDELLELVRWTRENCARGDTGGADDEAELDEY